MKYSISITKIKSNTLERNIRTITKDGKVMPSKKGNIALIDKDIRLIYKQLFDDALHKYNSKIKIKSRRINNYFTHVYYSKVLKTFQEIVVQVGNKDKHLSNELALKIYSDYVDVFIKSYAQFEVVGAYIHFDTCVPHLHLDYIPYLLEQKIGLEKRISNDGALKQMGYSFLDWKEKEFKSLEKIINKYGLAREEMHNHDKHIPTSLYAKYYKEISSLKDENSKLKEENDILKTKIQKKENRL